MRPDARVSSNSFTSSSLAHAPQTVASSGHCAPQLGQFMVGPGNACPEAPARLSLLEVYGATHPCSSVSWSNVSRRKLADIARPRL
jgi:hypothetical protein